MKSKAEQKLYEALRKGDPKAIERVYIAYRSEFINFFKRYEVSEQQILDLYQDSIIVIYQKFAQQQYQLEQSSLKTYLFGIGKNKVYTYLKRQKKSYSTIEQADVDAPSFEFLEEPSNYEKLLAKKIKMISESCRSILKLFYYENLSYKEIVSCTDYKDVNTVKSHKSRCLKKLRALCKAHK